MCASPESPILGPQRKKQPATKPNLVVSISKPFRCLCGLSQSSEGRKDESAGKMARPISVGYLPIHGTLAMSGCWPPMPGRLPLAILSITYKRRNWIVKSLSWCAPRKAIDRARGRRLSKSDQSPGNRCAGYASVSIRLRRRPERAAWAGLAREVSAGWGSAPSGST